MNLFDKQISNKKIFLISNLSNLFTFTIKSRCMIYLMLYIDIDFYFLYIFYFIISKF